MDYQCETQSELLNYAYFQQDRVGTSMYMLYVYMLVNYRVSHKVIVTRCHFQYSPRSFPNIGSSRFS